MLSADSQAETDLALHDACARFRREKIDGLPWPVRRIAGKWIERAFRLGFIHGAMYELEKRGVRRCQSTLGPR